MVVGLGRTKLMRMFRLPEVLEQGARPMVARGKLDQLATTKVALAVGLAVGLALLGRMALQVAVLPLVLVALAVEQRLLKAAMAALLAELGLWALPAALLAAVDPVAVLRPVPQGMAARAGLARSF
jgi:4-amino-4-deoxy-L-arabinose transferase-like glycosyltransferase